MLSLLLSGAGAGVIVLNLTNVYVTSCSKVMLVIYLTGALSMCTLQSLCNTMPNPWTSNQAATNGPALPAQLARISCANGHC